jgi:DNA repair exonuclease SbcCD ATPase subunit
LCRSGSTLVIGENGAGKSTFIEALTFGLYGKPFRNINKPQLMNAITGKGLLVEIEFSIGKKEYMIRRGIKPTIFEIYQNGSIINQQAASRDDQVYLEKSILKLNFKSFSQIVVLGSANYVPFMQLTAAQRRGVVEDLLDIQIFSIMNINLKEKLKFSNDDIKDRDYQIDLLEEKVTMQKNFIDNLDIQNQNDIQEKNNKVIHFVKLEQEVNDKLEQLNQDRNAVNEEMKEFSNATAKLKKLGNLRGKIQQKFSSHRKEHEFFTENTTCPTCTQHINEDLRDTKVSEILGIGQGKVQMHSAR